MGNFLAADVENRAAVVPASKRTEEREKRSALPPDRAPSFFPDGEHVAGAVPLVRRGKRSGSQ